MDYKEIQELLKFVNKSDLTEVLIEQEGFKLRIQRKQAAANVIYGAAPAPMLQAPVAQAPAAAASAESAPKAEVPVGNGKKVVEFKAPFIGTFYRSASPDKPAFVKVGDEIRSGQVLGIIEAMKLFNEIESDVEGRIVKILVENASPVEYEQPLFLIELP
jgi:acetyl-CoA carboxylase biotin carboxyl carrier protein